LKTFEYVAKVLPDGHLPVPDNVARKLRLEPDSELRVSLFVVETPKKGLARLRGKWKDDRNMEGVAGAESGRIKRLL